MKAADLREKSVTDLNELRATLARDVFQNRLKNFTNRLDDTSAMRKTRRDLARVLEGGEYGDGQVSDLQILRHRRIARADGASDVSVLGKNALVEPLPEHAALFQSRDIRTHFVFTIHREHEVSRFTGFRIREGEEGETTLYFRI